MVRASIFQPKSSQIEHFYVTRIVIYNIIQKGRTSGGQVHTEEEGGDKPRFLSPAPLVCYLH